MSGENVYSHLWFFVFFYILQLSSKNQIFNYLGMGLNGFQRKGIDNLVIAEIKDAFVPWH